MELASEIELVRTELARTKLAQMKLVQTELVRTELARMELVRTELVQTELVQTELAQTELVAVRYQGSLESYTSLQRVFGAQSLVESIRALLLRQGLAQVKGQQSKLRLEIRRPKELEVFNSLKLSIVVLAEILVELAVELLAELVAELIAELVAELIAELLAEPLVDVLVEILADVLADVIGGTELKAQVETRQPEELEAEKFEVFLMAIRYQDSLESQTSFGA